MSENSKIEWTDHTFNPWIGCTKVSPACDHCYAERSTPSRALGVEWGAHAARRRTAPENWNLPRRWNARHEIFAAQHGRRQRVFCASLADVFDNAVPALWRRDLAALIEATPELDWLLLTKRIGNAAAMLVDMFPSGTPDHVWLGATIANQAEADRDVPKLLAVPARVRFLSMEPLLGPVDLTSIPCGGHRVSVLQAHGLHWVIVGGESGSDARPMHPDWARSLRDQCAAAGVPFLFKQWGEWIAEGIEMPTPLKRAPDPYRRRWVADDADDDRYTPRAAAVHPVGKKAAGRLLDGRTHDEFPEAR
ncbi:hypothetical protein WK59_04020 [Burkholderia ubonensis]|uniref:phage Gp37/Gp68 family protein n=1 Tax=Burkholderia ubonensis TaxID=101571 RepID=UPI00075D08A2|nr:phage Gp37/Gp68 family protein [Burkholderia ubonensis]KVT91911.1 hypothetical protein WK59_04020 [Burkholderia ubonensis]